MFEPSPDLQAMIDRLYIGCLHLGRGDTLAHEAIREILGVDPHEHPWDYVVEKTRRRIQEERGIATWSSHGVGYRLCTLDEQANDVPRRRLKQAGRRVRKGLESVEALPVEDLTAHQQVVRAVRIEQTRRMKREIAAQIRGIEAFAARPEAPPRVRPVSLAGVKFRP